MTIPELEAYFHRIDLQKTLELDEATTIIDSKLFLSTNIQRAKNWMGDPDRNPSMWHLQRLHDVWENQA